LSMADQPVKVPNIGDAHDVDVVEVLVQPGARIEADHIVGDLLARGAGTATPTLRIALAHLKTYETRRERELADAVAAL